MAFFEMSDLYVSKKVISLNSFIVLQFTIKNTAIYMNGKRSSIGFTFALMAKNSNISYPVCDEMVRNITLEYGKVASFSLVFKIPEEHQAGIAAFFEQNSDKRALPLIMNVRSRVGVPASGGEEYHIISQSFDVSAHYLRSLLMPEILNFKMFRVFNEQKRDDGESVLSSVMLSCRHLQDISFMSVRLHYAENDEVSTASPYIDLLQKREVYDFLTGIDDSLDLITRQFSNGSNWDFMLYFGDEYESITSKQTFARAFANLHLSGQPTGGACFGGFSSSEYGKPKLESHYPGYFYRGINGVNIFSEGEVLTGGRWVDNKPIYRKAIKLPAVAKDTSSTTGIIQVDPDIGHLLDYYGVVQRENGYWYPLNFRSLSNSAYQVDCYIDADGYVVLRTGSSTALNGGYMICYYTKASDAAIEDDDGVAALVDETGATVADSAGVAYSVRAYNADVYQSQYSGSEIDSGIARALTALPLGGGTMTGPLILSGDPTVPFGAVTKQFLENELKKIELTPGAGVVNITITEVV
jgi:hypothetical protein